MDTAALRETELGLIPADWTVTDIGSVAIEVGSGITPRGGNKVYLSEGVPFVRSQNVQMNRLSFDDIAYISSQQHEQMKRTQLQPGDVLLNITGASIGRVVWVPQWLKIANINQHVCRIRFDRCQVIPEFVSYFLSTDRAQTEIMGTQYGTTRQGLNYGQVRMLRLVLPPLPEQRRIAAVLNAVQETIAAQDDVIAAARAFKRSLMQRLFTYGPNKEPAETKETEIGEIPAHWGLIRLGEVLSETQYGINNRAELKGTYPVLRMNNLVDGKIDIADLKYVDLASSEFDRYRLNQNDVLFNRTNSYELVGKTSIFELEGEYTFASYLVRVVPKSTVLMPGYLNYCLNAEVTQARLKQFATRGVSQSNISPTKLKQLVIGLPPFPEQLGITGILESMDQKIAAEEDCKTALQAFFKSMLHLLMTGQIRLYSDEGLPVNSERASHD